MAKVITVTHQKGGVGKSTLAINLALCFQDHLSVALVDTDFQGSLYHIRQEFPELQIIGVNEFEEMRLFPQDLVIVDTPPYLSDRLPVLFANSDFILVPTKAGIFDVMAIRATIQMVKDAQLIEPRIKLGVVLNMVKHRSSITKEITDLLTGMDAPLLNSKIHDRVSIARSALTGGILKGTDQKAKEEITSLAEELVNLISN
ncbi:ATPase [Mucilaginibacter sp. MD40]|uniref:ParA family protein n=1 Tax=Mucilaginibacter sp. MD40 TaxID=2029590 RepID=UPI000BAC7FE8|nr:ParA family protein [Mucilaginibacter sp. MD40]PAW92295.1 ATPase [Mucilaginibacter sp. MD40]